MKTYRRQTLCGCCSGPDCGMMCCIQHWCCHECIFGSAMEHIGVMDCPMMTAMLVCCNEFAPCIICWAADKTKAKYDLDESGMMICCKGLFCPCCLMCQIENEIMDREGLKYGCMKLEIDEKKAPGGAPEGTEMAR